jgi:hypothetical protein
VSASYDDPDRPPRDEPVGSAAEEAGRLFAALQDWVHGAQASGSRVPAGDAPECGLCPVCRLLRVARTASPEVYGHLADAADSLTAALRALAAGGEHPATPGRPDGRHGVENIDIG